MLEAHQLQRQDCWLCFNDSDALPVAAWSGRALTLGEGKPGTCNEGGAPGCIQCILQRVLLSILQNW